MRSGIGNSPSDPVFTRPVDATGGPAGASGPQPAASSQSVTPATNSAPFPTYTSNQAGNIIATVGAPNAAPLGFGEPGLTTRGTVYGFDPNNNGVLTLFRADATGQHIKFQPRGKTAGLVNQATTNSQNLFAANPNRTRIVIQNQSTAADPIWINLGAAATATAGGGSMRLGSGATLELLGTSEAVTVIAGTATPIVGWEF